MTPPFLILAFDFVPCRKYFLFNSGRSVVLSSICSNVGRKIISTPKVQKIPNPSDEKKGISNSTQRLFLNAFEPGLQPDEPALQHSAGTNKKQREKCKLSVQANKKVAERWVEKLAKQTSAVRLFLTNLIVFAASFDPIWGHIRAILWQNGALGVIQGHFGVVLASFWQHFGAVLALFWHCFLLTTF